MQKKLPLELWREEWNSLIYIYNKHLKPALCNVQSNLINLCVKHCLTCQAEAVDCEWKESKALFLLRWLLLCFA